MTSKGPLQPEAFYDSVLFYDFLCFPPNAWKKSEQMRQRSKERGFQEPFQLLDEREHAQVSCVSSSREVGDPAALQICFQLRLRESLCLGSQSVQSRL